MVYFSKGKDHKSGKDFVMVQVVANKEYISRHPNVYWDLKFIPDDAMRFFGPVLDEDLNIALDVLKEVGLDSIDTVRDKAEIENVKLSSYAGKLILIEFGNELYLARHADQKNPRTKKLFADVETNLTTFMNLYTSQFRTTR